MRQDDEKHDEAGKYQRSLGKNIWKAPEIKYDYDRPAPEPRVKETPKPAAKPAPGSPTSLPIPE